MPLIQLDDYLRFVLWAAENPEASGPYNLTLPAPTTNGEFTDELAGQLHRPRFLKAPKAVLSTVLGDFAEQLLGDVWLLPQQAVDQGFEFLRPRRRPPPSGSRCGTELDRDSQRRARRAIGPAVVRTPRLDSGHDS